MKDYSRYSDWKQWRVEEFGGYSEEDAQYFEKELKKSGIASVTGLCVLEIGFGNGRFAGWVRNEGGNYVGIEAIQDLVDIANESGIVAHSASDVIDGILTHTKFHLVAAFDVFEHLTVEEIRRLLVQIHNNLYETGLVLARVPSGDSPFSRAIQHGDLTHVTTFGSSAVRQLIAPLEYDVTDIRDSEFVYFTSSIKSTSRRLTICLIRKILYPLIRLAFMGGGNKILGPNMVFTLRPKS